MLGSLISAGSSLLGGIFGKSSNADANRANWKNQKKMAQNQIQWKVADAKAAGVSPIYALGAPSMSFAPTHVGDTSMPAAMSSMGQDIGRAVHATQTGQGRFDTQLQALQLERGSLENELLKSQIAQLRSAQVGPPAPGTPSIIPGQGDAMELVVPQRTTHFINPRGEKITTYALPDAQTYEDRYGEMGSGIYGVRNWLYDNFPGVMKGLQRKVVIGGSRPPWR